MSSVLQVITDTDRRGAQVFAVDLERALRLRGRDVKTVALVDGRGSNRLPVAHLGNTSFGWRTLRGLRREIQAAHVVIAHGSRALPAARLSMIGTGAALIYRAIGDPRYWAKGWFRRSRFRFLLNHARAVVSLWADAANTLIEDFGVARERIRIIANAVPAERFQPVDSKTRTRLRHGLIGDQPSRLVIYIGSLTSEKNVEAVIKAISQLPAQLLVVGEGPERDRLESLASVVAPRRVCFVPLTADPAALIGSADALVLASHSEGMPAVLIEAALCGVPVVATRVGAIEEIVIHGKTGWLVTPGDHTAIAEALRVTFETMTPPLLEARQHCLARFEIGTAAASWDDLLTTLGAWEPEKSLIG